MPSGLTDILFVALGGATGAVCRYALQLAASGLIGKYYPTLAINLIGCLVIGILWAVIGTCNTPAWFHRLLIAGFLGGFTTFSSFALDTVTMLQTGRFIQASIYTGISVAGGIILCAAGMRLTGRIIGTFTTC